MMTTTHQPSGRLFIEFDNILLDEGIHYTPEKLQNQWTISLELDVLLL